MICFRVPDLDSTNTASIKLIDKSGFATYDSGAKAESADHVLTPTQLNVVGNTKCRIETSGDQSADRQFKVVIYYETEGV